MIAIHQTKDTRKPKIRLVPMTPMAVEAITPWRPERSLAILFAPTEGWSVV